ncbi:MAG: ABC transporter ATP-binding protein [Erysipelothrix sp.]|nr:ABC transporter ATP-binding protein [Erysipelothrix sp.]
MDTVVMIQDLVKYYKDFKAVDGLNFEVKKGQIVGLLGPNGSGKSTTINCLLGLLNYQEGQIELFNQPMKADAYDLKRKIGVVFQDVAVFEELTVYENIDYFCSLYVKDKKERKEKVKNAIDLVAINNFVKHKPKQLSGGLLRRLNIACGIAHQPELIIFDEPTVGVDPQSRNHILKGIEQLNQEGATVIYTSHYMEEVEQLCDEIVIIDDGKNIAKGTKDELLDLIETDEKITLTLNQIPEGLVEAVKCLDNFHSIDVNTKSIEVSFTKSSDNLGNLIALTKEHHIDYESIYSVRPTLNDVFLALTKKALRDE